MKAIKQLAEVQDRRAVYDSLNPTDQRKADLVEDTNELLKFLTDMMARVNQGKPERRIERLAKIAAIVTNSCHRFNDAVKATT